MSILRRVLLVLETEWPRFSLESEVSLATGRPSLVSPDCVALPTPKLRKLIAISFDSGRLRA